MTTFLAPERSASSRTRMIGLLLVLLGASVCLVRVYLLHKSTTVFGGDFRPVYASCRCVISGCNPYYSAETRVQFLRQGGLVADAMTTAEGPFRPYVVGYPPPSLFYMVPFALLRWPLALFVYLGIALALYGLAVVLFSDLCSQYNSLTANACLGLFLAIQGKIVWLGQPTLLAAALLCIAVWCLIKKRLPWIGVFCFALSLVYKPPLGALFLLYFLVATPAYRKRAWQVIALTVALCLPALLWFSTHAATHNWIADYQTNLVGISAPGNLSDPGPKNVLENQIIDLQTIVSLYRDVPSFYNHVVWAFSAVFLVAWLYPVVRRQPGPEKDILCLAAIAAFSMLPIYHRVYDSRALLILFPAVALLNQRALWWGRALTMATVLMSVVLSDWYSGHTHPVGSIVQFGARRLLQIASVHAAPLVLLAIAISYLALLYVYPPGLVSGTESTPRTVADLYSAPVH